MLLVSKIKLNYQKIKKLKKSSWQANLKILQTAVDAK